VRRIKWGAAGRSADLQSAFAPAYAQLVILAQNPATKSQRLNFLANLNQADYSEEIGERLFELAQEAIF